MRLLLLNLKGLLRKSFFFFAVLHGADAVGRTLIFQSSEQASTTEVDNNPPSAGAVVNKSPASSVVAKPATVRGGGASNVSSELFFMVEQLKQEVMALRGLVEEQGYQLNQLQRSAKDRYAEIDGRLMGLTQRVDSAEQTKGAASSEQHSPARTGSAGKVVGAAAIAGGVVPVESAENSEPTEEQKVEYQTAYGFVKDRDFPRAVDALHAYVEKYPDGDLTGNAFYWLGEVYLTMPKLEQAKQAFTIVVKTFPGHRKLADAMYKLAVAHDRLQESAEAEVYLQRVQQEYPNSTAARLAKNYAMER